MNRPLATDEENEYESALDPHQEERETGSGTSSSSDSECSNTSQSDDTEWASHIKSDGSLVYIESYMSSTVKEKQVYQAPKVPSDSEKKLLFPSPQKNIKHHTKLLNLLRRRPSVRLKSQHTSSGEGTKCSPTNVAAESSSPKVTFRDNPSGEARTVILKVTGAGSNYGRRASLCETVLGIMPGRFSEPPDSRVMVAGLIPGSQALKDGIIKIGDWLKEVDGREITWENLDDILTEIKVPSAVTLLVQKCASETLPHDDSNLEKRITQTQLVKLLSGDCNHHQEWNLKVQSNEVPLHTVLYLSLQGITEESQDREDIKYQFPSFSSKLVQVRGMFITVAHALQEVVGTPALSSTIVLEGDYYHVAYFREDFDVFMMILPHSLITRSGIVILMEQLSKLIMYEYGSLVSAFINMENKEQLDHLFTIFFENLVFHDEKLKNCIESKASYWSTSPVGTELIEWKSSCLFSAPSWLILKDDAAKIQIETCLNELESGDFGEDEFGCEDCQLLYNILGCSIFYKGHLVSSHLDYESLQNVFFFLRFHNLLHLVRKEAVSQLILWKRVYPHQEDFVPSSGDVRHYLLIVAMNHFMLAMLLESGNVTELLDEKAGPDPFLVDQAETTLYHLHSLHIHSACEESLCSGGIETASLDSKLTAATPLRKNKQKLSESPDAAGKTPDVPSILKQKSHSESAHHYTHHVHDFPSCDCEKSLGEGSDEYPSPPCSKDSSFTLPEGDEEDVDDEEKDYSSDSDFRIWKGSESRSGYAYSPEVRSTNPKGDPSPPVRVTVGRENVLLHFLHLDVGDGILITSLSGTLSSYSSSLHQELLQNFYSTCSHIQHVLHTGFRNKICNSNYIGVSALNNVKEYGIMFDCSLPPTASGSGRKKSQTVSYWVIGRVYGPPYEREIYVAIEDTIPQNIQEIAFKISLGCS